MNNREDLDSIFNSRSVAIAGVSTDNMGRMFLDNLLGYGFGGRIFPLNPKGGEISGLKVYPGIRDVPEQVDYVISCISAPLVPQLIEDCVAKGVKVVTLFSAGFSEIGSKEGRELEIEVRNLAHAGGIRIIGPNCLGVYCPKSGLSFAADFPRESGHVAMVCQSGGNAVYFVRAAAQRGVRFSKVVCYGNACDLDESDLLEYFVGDTETEIVAAYIEGVKDGRRFYRVLKELASLKPVIVLKGGYTEAGAVMAASHTGSLAGSGKVWEGLLQQAGALQVDSLEELVDMAVTFSYMSLPRGRRLVMFGIGGGVSVLAADECTAAGFSLPQLPEQIREGLRRFLLSDAGNILDNPIDLSFVNFGEKDLGIPRRLSTYDDFDLLIAHLPLGFSLISGVYFDNMFNSLVDTFIKIHREVNKPMAVVIHTLTSSKDMQIASNFQRRFYEAGIPVYNSISSAAKAIDLFLRYHENRSA